MSSSQPDKTKTDKLITVVATRYLELVALDLLGKSFKVYERRDFKATDFQVSVLENAYATSAIILTVLGIEAYRNRIFYLKGNREVGLVTKDLSDIIKEHIPTFPRQFWQNILNEIFVIRDAIAHNHIYEVDVFYADDWRVIGHEERLLEGYGDDKKFRESVDPKTRQTKFLNLNIQPAKIGFEDLFTVIIFTDLFIGIYQQVLGPAYIPFNLSYKLGDEFEDNVSKILAYYYDQIPDKGYKQRINHLCGELRQKFVSFLAKEMVTVNGEDHPIFDREYVLTNKCPKCDTFGFNKPRNINRCNECNFKIELGPATEIGS